MYGQASSVQKHRYWEGGGIIAIVSQRPALIGKTIEAIITENQMVE